jgi:nitrate reductase NapE component
MKGYLVFATVAQLLFDVVAVLLAMHVGVGAFGALVWK